MSSIPKKIDAKPARSVLSNWGAFLFAALVSFFMGPYVLNKLGATTYGVWMLIGTLVSYLALLDLGVRSAVTKFVATRYGAGDHAGARAVKSAALLAFVLAAAIAVVATLAISPFADQIFTIPSELKTTAKYVIVICGLNVALSLVSGVYGGILVARHRFDLLNLVNVALVVARSVAMVVVLELHQGIFALALIQLGSSVIQLFMTEILCRKVYPEAMKGPAQPFSMGNVQMLFSFGLLTSMVHILGAVAHYSAPLIIGSMLPVAMVTYFSIAALLTDYARQLVSGISQTLTPVVGAMEGARQLEAVGRAAHQRHTLCELRDLAYRCHLHRAGAHVHRVVDGGGVCGPRGSDPRHPQRGVVGDHRAPDKHEHHDRAGKAQGSRTDLCVRGGRKRPADCFPDPANWSARCGVGRHGAPIARLPGVVRHLRSPDNSAAVPELLRGCDRSTSHSDHSICLVVAGDRDLVAGTKSRGVLRSGLSRSAGGSAGNMGCRSEYRRAHEVHCVCQGPARRRIRADGSVLIPWSDAWCDDAATMATTLPIARSLEGRGEAGRIGSSVDSCVAMMQGMQECGLNGSLLRSRRVG